MTYAEGVSLLFLAFSLGIALIAFAQSREDDK